MFGLVRNASLVGLAVAALSVGGCATQESVEHAQATADSALSAAHAGQGAAQHAQQTADAAGSTAQGAAADAARANTRLAALEPDVEHLSHHHLHKTWSDVGLGKHKKYRMPKKQASNAGSHHSKHART